jgi:hypothetical protein
MRTPLRSTTLAAAVAAVLVGGLGFTAGSLTSADAGPAPVTKAPVTKAQVKKIAARQARKEIKKAAPTLQVASAQTVVDQRTKPFAVVLEPDAAPVVVGTVSGLTVRAACPAGTPSLRIAAPDGRYRVARFVNSTLSGAGDEDLAGGSAEMLTGLLGAGTLAYVSAAGKAVSSVFGWRPDGAKCHVFGTLLG